VNDLRTDDEQVEQIKRWVKENGASVATGILIGLTVLFGGKAWTEYKARQTEQASNIYTQLTAALASGNQDAAIAAESAITGDHASSPYAVLAQLQMARQKLDAGEADAARAHLQWALDHAKMPQLAHIARLRLARLALGEGDLDQVQALISVTEQGSFAGAYEEILADLYAKQGDKTAAIAAYDKALSSIPPRSPSRGLVTIKRDELQQDLPAGPEGFESWSWFSCHCLRRRAVCSAARTIPIRPLNLYHWIPVSSLTVSGIPALARVQMVAI
jgi:predicted negative regulator of RcsB-dependent stress response